MHLPSTLSEGSESIYHFGPDMKPGLGFFLALEYFLAFNGYLPSFLVGTRNDSIMFIYALVYCFS
jgi:hypothetical protein